MFLFSRHYGSLKQTPQCKKGGTVFLKKYTKWATNEHRIGYYLNWIRLCLDVLLVIVAIFTFSINSKLILFRSAFGMVCYYLFFTEMNFLNNFHTQFNDLFLSKK